MIRKQKFQLSTLFASLVLLFSSVLSTGLAQACSATPDPNQGTDTVTVSAPATGNYYIWGEIQQFGSGNSFYAQSNGGCAVSLSGGGAGSWTWVNAPTTIALNSGNNSILLTGNGSNVGVRGLFFATMAPSTGCTPTNTAACSVTNTPPSVSMTQPANGATVSGTTTVSATASGNNGATIKNVQFQMNGANLNTAVTGPISGSTYQTSWDTTKVVTGSIEHLTAVATDSNNLQTTSGITTVTVSNPQNKPGAPTGLKTTSVSNSQVALSWTASTGSDPAATYKIYRNGSNIGTSATTSYTDSSVTPNTTYSYTVSGVDASHTEGPQSSSINVNVPGVPDTTPPTVNMTAPPAGNVSGRVTVSATATDNVQVKSVQFYLDYGTSSAATLGGVITPPAGSKTYNASYSWDTTALANGSHAVSAVVSDGVNTAVAATPVNVTINNQPGGNGGKITISFNPQTKTLSWTAYSGASSYTVAQIHSSSTNYSWPHVSAISCVPGGSCNVPVPTAGESLKYNVDPLNSSGGALDSPAWSAATPITVTWPNSGNSGTPPTPTGLTATASSSSQVNLAWSAGSFNGDPATGYQVFRKTGSGSFSQIATATNTTFGDSGLNPSTTYSYYVVAVDSAGHTSDQSNTANATTQPVSNGKYNATVMGVISDSKTGKPIAGVKIVTGSQATARGSETTYTNSQGQYVLTGLDSTAKHHYYNTAHGYHNLTFYVQIPSGTTVANIKMNPL